MCIRDRHTRVSLSVQKENFAVNLYRKVGFEIAADHGEEYIMACDLKALPESEQPCHCKVLALSLIHIYQL